MAGLLLKPGRERSESLRYEVSGCGTSSQYLLAVSLLTWLGLLHAGVEPALSGIPIGVLLPLQGAEALHPWVAFAITLLFALANAGLSIGGLSWHDADSMTVLAGSTDWAHCR